MDAWKRLGFDGKVLGDGSRTISGKIGKCQKLAESYVKEIPERPQSDPKVTPKLPQTDSKPTQNRLQTDPKPIPNQFQTDPKASPNRLSQTDLGNNSALARLYLITS